MNTILILFRPLRQSITTAVLSGENVVLKSLQTVLSVRAWSVQNVYSSSRTHYGVHYGATRLSILLFCERLYEFKVMMYWMWSATTSSPSSVVEVVFSHRTVDRTPPRMIESVVVPMDRRQLKMHEWIESTILITTSSSSMSRPTTAAASFGFVLIDRSILLLRVLLVDHFTPSPRTFVFIFC